SHVLGRLTFPLLPNRFPLPFRGYVRYTSGWGRSMHVFQRPHRGRFSASGLCVLTTLLMLIATTAPAFAQATTTATVRGHVEDPSGAVLPGATVTLTHTGTKAPTVAVTDGRGQYLVSVFPGTYDLKVELSGFKNYEQKNLTLSPSDARGIDARLEVGRHRGTSSC